MYARHNEADVYSTRRCTKVNITRIIKKHTLRLPGEKPMFSATRAILLQNRFSNKSRTFAGSDSDGNIFRSALLKYF